MSDKNRNMLLRKLLLRNNGKGRLWAAMIALFVGNTLLLLSVLIWWNFNELLYGKTENDSLGSTFLIIGKKVTNSNMGQRGATLFTPADIDSVNKAPQVQSVGAIVSNHFPVYAMMGGDMGFATDLPLESVPDSFLDSKPADWDWQPGSRDLPIIMSSQFLDLYNYVFAPSQGLPQLSESSVKSLALNVKAGPPDMAETYTAHVVGFSDRIGSVMVPQAFIDYGNQKYGKQGSGVAPSQLILKTKDPSDLKFTQFIQRKNYTTNSQNLRWSRVRAIVEVVASATGVLAILLMAIGTLVFVLFIELTIAKAHQSLTLLKEIGYSPGYLSGFMVKRFVPLVLVVVIFSAGATLVVQYLCADMAKAQGLVLHALPGLPVWAALAVSTGILLVLVVRSISGAIRK